MRRISATAHGILDFVVVVYLLVGPTVTEFRGPQRIFCYWLALSHLLLALVTRYRFGIFKTLPMPVHGAVEMFFGLLLLALPWIADFAAGVHSRNFFVLTGMIVLIVWAMTDHRGRGTAAAESHAGVAR